MRAIAVQIFPRSAAAWWGNPHLPSRARGFLSISTAEAYRAAGQAISALHAMVLLQAYQTKALKQLHEGSSNSGLMQELHTYCTPGPSGDESPSVRRCLTQQQQQPSYRPQLGAGSKKSVRASGITGTGEPEELDSALQEMVSPAVYPGKSHTSHSDPTSGRTAFQVGSLYSTSLPHCGYVGGSLSPACSVSGGLARAPQTGLLAHENYQTQQCDSVRSTFRDGHGDATCTGLFQSPRLATRPSACGRS